jgi:hypothetical protein
VIASSLYPGRLDWPHLTPFGAYGLQALRQTAANGSAVWGSANRAIYYPVRIPRSQLIARLFWANGATVSGNVDAGVYTETGVRLVSTGSTAQAGTLAIQEVAITPRFLQAGWVVYLALVLDNTTGAIIRANFGVQSSNMQHGVLSQNTAFPLPAPATMVTDASSGYGALVGMSERGFI